MRWLCTARGSWTLPLQGFALALAFLFLPTLTTAQTQTVRANTPLKATFSPSPDAVTGYRCFLNGKQIAEVPATARECELGSVTPGDYLAEVLAFNQFGESPKVGASFTAGVPPGPPSGVEVEVVTTAVFRVQPNPDGSLAVNVVRVGSDVSQVSTTAAPSTDR